MKKRSGFTLMELLVVITILAIISVVAYTQFGGVTDKAKNSTKTEHMANIESALQLFYQQNNYYPMPSTYDATTNVWGYNKTISATPTATFTGSKLQQEILSVSGTLMSGGGIVYQSG